MITETLGYTHHDIEIMSQKKNISKEECPETKHICICVKTGNVWHCIVYFWGKKLQTSIKSALFVNFAIFFLLVFIIHIFHE